MIWRISWTHPCYAWWTKQLSLSFYQFCNSFLNTQSQQLPSQKSPHISQCAAYAMPFRARLINAISAMRELSCRPCFWIVCSWDCHLRKYHWLWFSIHELYGLLRDLFERSTQIWVSQLLDWSLGCGPRLVNSWLLLLGLENVIFSSEGIRLRWLLELQSWRSRWYPSFLHNLTLSQRNHWF